MSRIDAAVVAYNSGERLAELLPRLRSEALIGSVVVVDHGTDDSAEVARSMGAEVVVDRTNPGFGAGQNRAVERTSARYVLLVNPDLVPVTDALPTAVRLLDDHPMVAAVQGVIRSEADGTPERSAGRSLGPVHLWGRLLRLRRLLANPVIRTLARRSPALGDHVNRVADEPRRVDALAATMVLVRRQAFDAVGGFDESYFLYGEDLDLCRRLREADWELWSLPETWATHASGESSDGRWDRELVWWEGTMRFAAMHWSTPAFGSALLAAAVRAVVLAAQRAGSSMRVWKRLVATPVMVRRRKR